MHSVSLYIGLGRSPIFSKFHHSKSSFVSDTYLDGEFACPAFRTVVGEEMWIAVQCHFNHGTIRRGRGHRGRGPLGEEVGREEVQGVAGADGRHRAPLQEARRAACGQSDHVSSVER